MTEPSDAARDVLARYRRSISPTADARDALVQSVVQRAGEGPSGGSAPPVGRGTPWLVVVGSAIVVALGVAWASAPRGARVEPAFDRPPVIEVAAPVAVAAVVPLDAPTALAPAPEPDASPIVEPARAKPRPRRAPATAAAEEESPSLVDEEVRLLRAANLALRAGRDGEARAGFDLHAQRFPDGALVELREVGRAVLACRDATPERAIATVDAFGARFPGSPHLARLVRECPTR